MVSYMATLLLNNQQNDTLLQDKRLFVVQSVRSG